VRHVEITDDDRNFFTGRNGRERLLRIEALGALETGASEHTLEKGEGGEIVVEKQYFLGHGVGNVS
jgi:hypothetical protein